MAALKSTKRRKPTTKSKKKKPIKRKSTARASNVSVNPRCFERPFYLSPEMASFLGTATRARKDLTKDIWAYVDQHRLKQSSTIICDARLRSLFGVDTITFLGLQKLLSKHLLYPVPDPPQNTTAASSCDIPVTKTESRYAHPSRTQDCTYATSSSSQQFIHSHPPYQPSVQSSVTACTNSRTAVVLPPNSTSFSEKLNRTGFPQNGSSRLFSSPPSKRNRHNFDYPTVEGEDQCERWSSFHSRQPLQSQAEVRHYDDQNVSSIFSQHTSFERDCEARDQLKDNSPTTCSSSTDPYATCSNSFSLSTTHTWPPSSDIPSALTAAYRFFGITNPCSFPINSSSTCEEAPEQTSLNETFPRKCFQKEDVTCPRRRDDTSSRSFSHLSGLEDSGHASPPKSEPEQLQKKPPTSTMRIKNLEQHDNPTATVPLAPPHATSHNVLHRPAPEHPPIPQLASSPPSFSAKSSSSLPHPHRSTTRPLKDTRRIALLPIQSTKPSEKINQKTQDGRPLCESAKSLPFSPRPSSTQRKRTSPSPEFVLRCHTAAVTSSEPHGFTNLGTRSSDTLSTSRTSRIPATCPPRPSSTKLEFIAIRAESVRLHIACCPSKTPYPLTLQLYVERASLVRSSHWEWTRCQAHKFLVTDASPGIVCFSTPFEVTQLKPEGRYRFSLVLQHSTFNNTANNSMTWRHNLAGRNRNFRASLSSGTREPLSTDTCSEQHNRTKLRPMFSEHGIFYDGPGSLSVPNLKPHLVADPLILVPRDDMRSWTHDDVVCFAQMLNIPGFAEGCKKCRVLGLELKSFCEKDILALGIDAPFLVRRILSSISQFSACLKSSQPPLHKPF